MRPHVRKLIICLALGVISTVAVAWSCALWSPMGSASDLRTPIIKLNPPPLRATEIEWLKDNAWTPIANPGIGTVELHQSQMSGLGVGQTSFFEFDRSSLSQDARGATRLRAGFPLSCFESFAVGHFVDIAKGRRQFQHAIDGKLGSIELPPNRVIPLRPLWVGLLANVGIHAALWLGLWWLILTFIHGQRALRGLCPRCRFDLRGDLANGCPECGWRRAEPARS